jgi:thiol-disulfide isomerase/thioredoxin
LLRKKINAQTTLTATKTMMKALAAAKSENKPLLIDFTGYNCANCRRMEENVWTDADVSKLISEKYILVSLYVDDYEKMLPDSMHYVSPFNGSLAYFLWTQMERFSDPSFQYKYAATVCIRFHQI